MRRYFPDLATFSTLAPTADVIPVYRQLLGDRLTPVSAFEVLGRDAHAFLLESVVGGEKIARYSFIATAPSLVYQVTDGNASIYPGTTRNPESARQFKTTDPLADLQKLLPRKRYRHDPHLPTFTGGLVGYAGYETIRYYEGEKLPSPPKDDRKLPDLLFGLYNELVIFDHVDKTIKVVANADLTAAETPEAAYRNACRRIDDIVQRLQQPPSSALGEIDAEGQPTLAFESNFTREQFENAVRKGQEYIKAGDIFQFVPSQRLRVKSSADPFDVYRALRIINPSPFMFYLKSPGCTLIGSSPEILCRVEGGKATSRPLAGTRRRGATPEEDRLLEAELLADPKERAEHIMLVDLHRNDIGRVSRIGSVQVSEVMTVERYSHVMHITTNVTGTLADGMTSFDALRVSLPVGTVSGAPKIRAMQIIDELEPTRRGPYGGAVGYMDFNGDMDTCIALRTIVWKNGLFDVQAGAGVVADSIPASEYDETMTKAKAMLKAVQIAEAGFSKCAKRVRATMRGTWGDFSGKPSVAPYRARGDVRWITFSLFSVMLTGEGKRTQTVPKYPSSERPPRFADRLVNSLWRLLAKLWYPVLTRLTRHSTISFLNYGYADDRGGSATLELDHEDETDRICIQLYDHLTAPIRLGGLKVLEVSCGHGGGASYLARYLKPKSLHAIDRNPHAIRLCKKRHKVPGLTFSCGNAMSLNFARNTFDAVVNVEASHCYPDLPHFFGEVCRVLRPGGYFIYADFRPRDPDHAALHRQVLACDMEFVHQENISREVLRGMCLNNDRYLQLIQRLVPAPLRKAARGFVGSEGSTIYQSLQSGKTVYFSYLLRKPAIS